MEIKYDPRKNERNIRKRGLSFERVSDFEFEMAWFVEDQRQDYGETRIRAFGYLDGRLHSLVFTLTGAALRVISLRRANRREVKRYETAKN
jgi:uncharacterized protein